SPTENTIYIFLGALEEPFYSEDMSDEELYASIGGFWVGHEISHSFDSNGSRFDAEGNIRDWWNSEDNDEFRRRIDKLDAYLDNVKPFGDYTIKGKNIDVEMLADITGVQCALRMAEKEEDFDYDAFFRKYASLNVSMTGYTEELALLLQDGHPLDYLRTNVCVQQFDEFYDTYGVKDGDTMYLAPDDRLTVW
ncbi:MAG: M13 family peptidase, partial [Lachnospiraceae bacterium]|nr:M13 family peptidase [Lachnospiraceae bacterium]